MGHGIQVRRCLIPSGIAASTGGSRSASSRCWRSCCCRRGCCSCGSRIASSAAAPRTPAQLATKVAEEVGAEIQQRPEIDLEAFVRDRFSRHLSAVPRRADQRAARVESAEWLAAGIQSIRHRAGFVARCSAADDLVNRRRAADPGPDGTDGRRDGQSTARGSTGDSPSAPAIEPRGFPGGPGPGGFGRRGGPRFPTEYAPIMAADHQVGVVAVPSNPPPVSVALRELGPTLTWLGARSARPRRDADRALRLPAGAQTDSFARARCTGTRRRANRCAGHRPRRRRGEFPRAHVQSHGGAISRAGRPPLPRPIARGVNCSPMYRMS